MCYDVLLYLCVLLLSFQSITSSLLSTWLAAVVNCVVFYTMIILAFVIIIIIIIYPDNVYGTFIMAKAIMSVCLMKANSMPGGYRPSNQAK